MSVVENKRFSKKFYIGIWLIIISLVVGKLTQAAIIIYFTNDFIRKLSVLIYLISWPPFLLGITWTGMEYAKKYSRFFTFKYYRERIRNRKK